MTEKRGPKPDHRPEDAPNEFTQRLRVMMADMEIRSNHELAEMCGIRESTIRNLWAGGDPKMATLTRIAEACDVSPTWLMFGVGRRRLSTMK